MIEDEKTIDTSAGKLSIKKGYIPVTTFADPVNIISEAYINVIVIKLEPAGWEYVIIGGVDLGMTPPLSEFLKSINLSNEEINNVYNHVKPWLK